MMPVFNKLFLLFNIVLLFLNFFSTNKSQAIIHIIPKIIPNKILYILDISKASGISSKHTIDVINPDANDKIKPKNFLDCVFKNTPKIPPIVVPKVPKNNPNNVVFNNSFKINTPLK